MRISTASRNVIANSFLSPKIFLKFSISVIMSTKVIKFFSALCELHYRI